MQINAYTNSEGLRRREFEIEAVAVDNLGALLSGVAAPVAAGRSVVKAAAAKPAGKGGSELSGDDLDAIFAGEDEIPF